MRFFATMEPMESRRMLAGQYPLAISFNDEALWSENFDTAVATCQQLGIKTIRLWLPLHSFADRPTPQDDEPAAGELDHGIKGPDLTTASQVLRRTFDLKDAGFNILVTVSNESGTVPTGTEVTDLFNYLINIPETPGSSRKLKDAIDRWEIGNEPDLTGYWNDPSSDPAVRVAHFVTQVVIPAADVLHGAGETVVSGAPSWNPNHIKTIVDTLSTAGKLGVVDYIGYHPYATFNPDDPNGANQQKVNVLKARGFAQAAGKQMIATEWNIRGFNNNGSADAKWVTALDQNFRNVMRDNFESAYYFALVNNWPARGGSISARTTGILEHPADATVGITPSSSVDDQNTYMESGLVNNEPFYGLFNSWHTGTVSGKVFNDTNFNGSQNIGETGAAGMTVFLDFNSNGVYNAGESSATTASDGSYTLTYDLATAPTGIYSVLVQTATGTTRTTPVALATVTAANDPLSGINIGIKSYALTPDITAGARVVSASLDNRGGATLTFTKTLDSVTLTRRTASIYTAGTDGILGTGDDYRVPTSIRYKRGQLTLRAAVPVNSEYRVLLNAGVVKDIYGVALDGEFNGTGVQSGNGIAGGHFDVLAKTPRRTIYQYTVNYSATKTGQINVALMTKAARKTSANFMTIADAGVWDTTFFHVSTTDAGFGIQTLQGGSFNLNGAGQIAPVGSYGPIPLELGTSHTLGTLAMAKGKSANQWFFNVNDNTSLDGKYAVFGLVADTTSQAILDTINKLPTRTFDAGNSIAPFSQLPVLDPTGTIDTPGDLVLISRVAKLMDVIAT